MSTKDPLIIMCSRVSTMNPQALVPGSGKTECEGCHQPIYVSPSTREHPEYAEASLLCEICAIERINRTKEVKQIPFTQKQIKEIKAQLFKRSP